jgi:4-hydroxy-3-methylbut-2-enyl diphosphate reductase
VVVIRSQSMGYCSGVSQVIEKAKEALALAKTKNVPAYSIGWFIHNPSVVNSFQQKGMNSIESPDGHLPGVALIRAHGIGDPLRKAFIDAGFTLIDGTCPTVAYSQRLIRTSDPSWNIVIIGQKGHSEVVALSRVWNKEHQLVDVTIIESEEEFLSLPSYEDQSVFLMVQTTFNHLLYEKLKQMMSDKYGSRLIMGNKLCPTTARRHKAVLELCKEVDAVIVVGGKMSANTRSLAQLVERQQLPVWHIETVNDLPSEIRKFAVVGVTAGASTPNEDIDEVIQTLESFN